MKNKLFENTGGNTFKLIKQSESAERIYKKTIDEELNESFLDSWKEIIDSLKDYAKKVASGEIGNEISNYLKSEINPSDKSKIDNIINSVGNKIPNYNQPTVSENVLFDKLFDKIPGSFRSKAIGYLGGIVGIPTLSAYISKFPRDVMININTKLSNLFATEWFNNQSVILKAKMANVDIIKPYLLGLFTVLVVAYAISFAIDKLRKSS